MDEVFKLGNIWHVRFNSTIVKAQWNERGPAETQLHLLKTGYSVIDECGNIKHVGAAERKQ